MLEADEKIRVNAGINGGFSLIINRTKNAARNIIYGVVLRIIGIVGPFLIRTLMIYKMGNEYVGLNSLFTSVISFLSLTELGIGSALVYSMYKPIAEDDKRTICALLNLYKRVYQIIGLIILVISIILLPFLKYLIKGDCPNEVNLYILYGIYVFNTVVSYELFAYKQSLLTAFQRNDIISKRSALLQLAMYSLQALTIIYTHNYYAYIFWMPVITILTNIANAIITNKMYPDLKTEGEIDNAFKKRIMKNVIALFGTKANSIVMHGADNIIISAFIGIIMVGKYGNYYYIMSALIGIMTVFYDSITAGLGNSLEVETVEKNHNDFNILSLLNFWITTFCSTCLLCLYQPFMRLWLGEDTMLSNGVAILLVVYFYIYQIRRIVLTYKDAAGVWWPDRIRPYLMMFVNIIGNVIMVQFIGIYGVVLSTIISMVISIPIENHTVFKYIFKCNEKPYYLTFSTYLIISVLSCISCYYACSLINDSIYGIIIRFIICLFLTNAVIIVICWRNKTFKQAISFIKKRLIHR